MGNVIGVSAWDSDPGLTPYWQNNSTVVPVEENERIFGRGCEKNTGLEHFLLREILDIPGISIGGTGEGGKGGRFELTMPTGKYRQKKGLD